MTSNTCYKIILYAAAKNLQNGYISPEDFNTVLMPTAQNEYADYLTGEYQKYQAGRPIAVVEIGNKEKIRQSISPLIYDTILPINPTTGLASYPSDYLMTDAMWSVYGWYNIRFVQQPRLASFMNSTIDPIADNPVYLLKEPGFQYYPARPYGENQAKMSYVRKPPSIVWGYVLDSNDIPVYNPATSQDPVWGDFDMLNIISRALRLIGVNLEANTLSQYAEEIKNVGQ